VRELRERLKFAFTLIADALIPMVIMSISYGFSVIASTFQIGSDIITQIVLAVGGVSSIATYSYLAISDFRSFRLQKETDIKLLKLDIDKRILLSSKELEEIQKVSRAAEKARNFSSSKAHTDTFNIDDADSYTVLVELVNSVAALYGNSFNLTVIMDMLAIKEAVYSSRKSLNTIDDTINPRGSVQAAHLTHWLARLKPFSRKGQFSTDADPSYEQIMLNEYLALMVGLSIAGIEQGAFNVGSTRVSRIIRQLRYGDISPEALALIFDCFAEEALKNANGDDE